MKNLLALIGLLTVLAGGGYLYAAQQGEGDPCRARAQMFADQIPPALDELSAKYPLKIGLVRRSLDRRGLLDDLLRSGVADRLTDDSGENDASRIECAYEYYGIWIFRDRVRGEIALYLEDRFNLDR